MKLTPQTPPPPPLVRVALAVIHDDRSMSGPSGGGSHPHPHHLLITRRLPGTVYAGYWEFPGGKIEPGETPEAAATREVAEELGVRLVPETVIPHVVHTYEHAVVELHTVVGTLHPGSPPPANLAVEAHAWRTLNELPWEEFLPSNVRVVTALRRHFGPHW